MSHYWFKEQKKSMAMAVVKKRLLSIIRKNNDALKEKARNRYRNLLKEKKEAKRDYLKSRYKEMKKNPNLFLSCINE